MFVGLSMCSFPKHKLILYMLINTGTTNTSTTITTTTSTTPTTNTTTNTTTTTTAKTTTTTTTNTTTTTTANTSTTATSTTITKTTSTTTTTPTTTNTPTCTVEYPFAYLNGDYCCKTNQELQFGGTVWEFASGSCDGKGFSRESTCCKGNCYQKCPQLAGCYDFNQTTVATTTTTTTTATNTTVAITATSTATTSATTTTTSTEEPKDVYSELVEMAFDTFKERKLTKGK
jgi:hypothetical protein